MNKMMIEHKNKGTYLPQRRDTVGLRIEEAHPAVQHLGARSMCFKAYQVHAYAAEWLLAHSALHAGGGMNE